MIVCFVFQTIVSCFDRKSRREVLFFSELKYLKTGSVFHFLQLMLRVIQIFISQTRSIIKVLCLPHEPRNT